jgi:uncharacterized iron-regulated protein
MMEKFLSWISFVLLGGFFLSGCAETTPRPPWVSNILMMSQPVGEEEIFALPQGGRISFRQLIDDLNSTTVVFLGETHDLYGHHEIQAKVIQELLKNGKEVVLAMEMFDRSRQPILDQWSQGALTEEEFLKDVKWETTWGMDYSFYKGILDKARDHHLKVVGLNIERDLVRKVAQDGVQGLSHEDKIKLPEMDLTDQEHRRYIASIYKTHHSGSAKDFENFYQAQCLWDEAMGETLSRFLRSPEGKGKTLVVLTGSGHVVFDFGIPKRFYRRNPVPYKTVILKEWKKKLEEEVTFGGTSSPLANFLWITKPDPIEKKRPRIGVVLKEKEDPEGLWIERVIPESPAEKAGLLPGDQFVSVEGKEITKVKDIHDALSEKGWGKEILFTIIREGTKKEITVTLPRPKE